MSITIYWFRNDLRLRDNLALMAACKNTSHLLPVYVHPPGAHHKTPWGFNRVAAHRQQFLSDALADLAAQFSRRNSRLVQLRGLPHEVLPALAKNISAVKVVCETIAAPEETVEVAALREAGLNVETVWQSSLLHPAELPFAVDALPDMFTTFRKLVEQHGVLPFAPLPAPEKIPPLPAGLQVADDQPAVPKIQTDSRSSFPYFSHGFSGGETAALAHLAQYFSRKLAHTYKATRNQLSGTEYSSKFSPWLASGALSARTAYAALKHFEAQHGANEDTYWLWFELLWRDYFRLLQLKYGRQLFRARGLSNATVPTHDQLAFERWCEGETGQTLIDAGMRELKITGYLSNRLRQNVASYLVHDLGGDWRAGAAWFEAQLLDYDVYSNQGNWLYIAGRGTDPRGGRRFNPEKQALDYDPNNAYRLLWDKK
jgi:deoxyribodipyrimidine photo-lyase